ncbi:hypothetical protein PMAYCL1PPCAC_27827, partial [Pristionchus mayeri]
KCSHCGSSFRSLGNRNEHIQNVHNIQTYACLTCGERFDRCRDWRRHLKSNEGHQAKYILGENPDEEEPNDEKPGPSRS